MNSNLPIISQLHKVQQSHCS